MDLQQLKLENTDFFGLKKILFLIAREHLNVVINKLREFQAKILFDVKEIKKDEIYKAIEVGTVDSQRVIYLFTHRTAMIQHHHKSDVKADLKQANELMKNFDRRTCHLKNFLELLDGMLSQVDAAPSEESISFNSVLEQFQEMLDKKKAKHLNKIKKLPLHKFSFEQITYLLQTIEVCVNKPPPECTIEEGFVWAAREQALRKPAKERTVEEKQDISEGYKVFREHDRWAKKFKPMLRYIEGIWLMQQKMNEDKSFMTWSQFRKQHGFADARSRGGTSGMNTPEAENSDE